MKKIIALALREDIGQADITTDLLVAKDSTATAYIMTHEPCVVAGLDVAQKVFRKLDRSVQFKIYHPNGKFVKAETKLIKIHGKTRSILTGERVALNFVSRLSAIATKTRAFVQKVKPYKAKIYDTRKTTPTLRLLEKEAVRLGGGLNHRFSLHEMILIKDNHHIVLTKNGGLEAAIHRIRKHTKKPIAIEVENLYDYRRVLNTEVDLILLDNMSLSQIRQAVQIRKKSHLKKNPQLEVSGRVNINNVARIAQLGVDRISIGALTHSIKSIDMSLYLDVVK